MSSESALSMPSGVSALQPVAPVKKSRNVKQQQQQQHAPKQTAPSRAVHKPAIVPARAPHRVPPAPVRALHRVDKSSSSSTSSSSSSSSTRHRKPARPAPKPAQPTGKPAKPTKAAPPAAKPGKPAKRPVLDPESAERRAESCKPRPPQQQQQHVTDPQVDATTHDGAPEYGVVYFDAAQQQVRPGQHVQYNKFGRHSVGVVPSPHGLQVTHAGTYELQWQASAAVRLLAGQSPSVSHQAHESEHDGCSRLSTLLQFAVYTSEPADVGTHGALIETRRRAVFLSPGQQVTLAGVSYNRLRAGARLTLRNESALVASLDNSACGSLAPAVNATLLVRRIA